MLEFSQKEERELLLLLKQGDREAFAKIHSFYNHHLHRGLMQIVKLEADAEEVLQETFLKLWEIREQIDPEKSFLSFLSTIATNKAFDSVRKTARDKKKRLLYTEIATSAYQHVEELFSRKENLVLVQQAIGQLPPLRQKVFRLCKMEEKSYREVSEQLGISVSTVSDHMVKASAFIKTYLHNHGRNLLSFLILYSLINRD